MEMGRGDFSKNHTNFIFLSRKRTFMWICKELFLEQKIRSEWIDNQYKTLLEDIPEKVISFIKALEIQEKTTKKESN